MRTNEEATLSGHHGYKVGMKPLSERDENAPTGTLLFPVRNKVGMKPLSERDENFPSFAHV